MTQKHTPISKLPWFSDDGYNQTIKDADGNDLMSQDSVQGYVLKPTDGKFILRACNAHDDLVAALEALNNSWIETFPNGPETELREGCSIHEDTLKIWRMAQAALAKAKVQS